MTTGSPAGRVLDELRIALAQADADAPPPGLRSRVLRAAEGVRPAGRPVDEPPAITPVEAYSRTVEDFSTLLMELTDDEWRRPALRDLDVQGLVGHLIGVELAFQTILGMGPSIDTTDHIGGTQPNADAQRGRAPADTRRDWLAVARQTLRYLEAAPPAALDETVALHGYTLPVRAMLVVRSFEMWIHQEDIRRTTGRPLVALDASRLTLMTNLAVAALPRGLARAGREQPGRTARIVLTGPGGGTWHTSLDSDAAAAPAADVRIVVDATTFCRVVGDRLDPSEAGAVITGDVSVGHDVLVGASALALD